MYRRLLKRQSTPGSGSPWPPTGFGYEPVSYVHTLCSYSSLNSHLQPQRQDTHFYKPETQTVAQLHRCTSINGYFLYFKSLQQDAELKEKNPTHTFNHPKQVGNGLLNSCIAGLTSDMHLGGHSAFLISLPPVDISPSHPPRN